MSITVITHMLIQIRFSNEYEIIRSLNISELNL